MRDRQALTDGLIHTPFKTGITLTIFQLTEPKECSHSGKPKQIKSYHDNTIDYLQFNNVLYSKYSHPLNDLIPVLIWLSFETQPTVHPEKGALPQYHLHSHIIIADLYLKTH